MYYYTSRIWDSYRHVIMRDLAGRILTPEMQIENGLFFLGQGPRNFFNEPCSVIKIGALRKKKVNRR